MQNDVPLEASCAVATSLGNTVLPATKRELYMLFHPGHRASLPIAILIAPIHRKMARLSLPDWLVTHRDKFSSTRSWTCMWSPISVLTGLSVKQLVTNNTMPNHHEYLDQKSTDTKQLGLLYIKCIYILRSKLSILYYSCNCRLILQTSNIRQF